MASINRYNCFMDSIGLCKPKYIYNDKEKNIADYTGYFLSRLHSMFKYDGLPESLPQRNIELMLLCNGHICITEVNGVLYGFTGGLGGEPDVYYMPTIYTVSNPALSFSKNLKIGEECIVIRNNTMYQSILSLLQRYISLLVENDISLTVATINSRMIQILTACTDNTKESADIYMEKIINGDLSIIGNTSIFDTTDLNLLSSNQGKTGIITDLIELEQYTKASLYNELGLNANYNMKRESINSGESVLNDDMLLPLVDDMLRCRQECFDEVNKKYGTDIKVALFSAWEDNKKEIDAEQNSLKIAKGGENEDVSDVTRQENTESDVSKFDS